MSNFRLLLEVRMKNWFSIGQFATKVSLTQRTLRVYEAAGLIKAHTRGENKYRYYTEEQVEVVLRIKQFKSFGFALNEIKSLLEVDISMNTDRLEVYLKERLGAIQQEQARLHSAEQTIQNILSSLKSKNQGLGPHERRFIMSQLEKISVVVAGVSGLEITAQYIRKHVESGGKKIPVIMWDGQSLLPESKPYILVIPEHLLNRKEVAKLSPDVVIIKELSTSSADLQAAYLQLYRSVGPGMSTILNADDRAVIEFAANETVRKGKTYYFSKNSAMQPQISRIGGAVSRGETIKIFGMNHSAEPVEIKMRKILGNIEEVAYLASLVAVMDFGLRPEDIQESLVK